MTTSDENFRGFFPAMYILFWRVSIPLIVDSLDIDDLDFGVKYLFLADDRSVFDVGGACLSFLQGNNSFFHDSLASPLSKTKKKNIQKPWRALKRANMNWRANAASRLVDTNVKMAKTQVSPNRNIMPQMESTNLKASNAVIEDLSNLCLFFCRLCLTKTRITKVYITVLNSITSSIGPRKAPKNTPTWLI